MIARMFAQFETFKRELARSLFFKNKSGNFEANLNGTRSFSWNSNEIQEVIEILQDFYTFYLEIQRN